MTKIFVSSIINIFLLVSCKSQSNEAMIAQTSQKIINAIETGSFTQFEKLIGADLKTIGKTQEMLKSDFENCEFYFNKYLKGNKTQILLTDDYNELGNRKVIIPFYNNSDSINDVMEIKLELYFGPPQFIELNRISNYKLVVRNKKQPSEIILPKSQ